MRKAWCLANISLETKDSVGTRLPGSPGKSHPGTGADYFSKVYSEVSEKVPEKKMCSVEFYPQTWTRSMSSEKRLKATLKLKI